MAAKALPSPEVLRQLLRYEPETGKLFWLPRQAVLFQDGGHSAAHTCAKWNARYAGKEALITRDKTGYLGGHIFDENYAAHRIIWALVTGMDPAEHEIDHRDLDRANNKISNLRIASSSQNNCNTPLRTDNKSGIKGVSWCRGRSKWDARVTFDRRTKLLGRFKCKAAAEIAVTRERQNMHGAFARVA